MLILQGLYGSFPKMSFEIVFSDDNNNLLSLFIGERRQDNPFLGYAGKKIEVKKVEDYMFDLGDFMIEGRD